MQIIVDTIDGDGSFDFLIFNATNPADFIIVNIPDTSINNQSLPRFIQAASYSVTETVPLNWTLESSDCLIDGVSHGSPLKFNIFNGQTVECIFVNLFTPTILNVDGDIKPGSFPNSVNCDNKGVKKGKSVTPIELFFGQGLVPSTVNLESLEISYAEGGDPTTLIEKHGKIHLEDLTDDDMDNPNGVIHVITRDLCAELEDLPNGEVEVTISGTQGNQEAWEFKDTICLVKQVGGGEGVECEGADDGEEEAEEKVTICHKKKKTISVSADSAAEHIAEHGDTEGPCNGNGGPPGQDKVTQEANKAAAKNLKESAKGELVPGEKLCKKILKIHDKIHDKVPAAHDLPVLDDLHDNVDACTPV